jgi:hypothetical protein
MLISPFIRLLRIILLRERKPKIKATDRYHVTLDMKKVLPGSSEFDANEWLMRLGFKPTARPNVWKAWEKQLQRLPRESVLKTEKL